MGRLSNISGKEAIKIFEKFGYILDHQTGSHMILWHDSKPTLSVPNHQELAPGLLRSLIRLERINQSEPGYIEAQKLLKTYQNNLKVIQYRMQLEANATETLDDIYNRAESLAQSPPTNRESYILELQDLIKELKTIKPGTTAYTDAQKLMVSAEKRLKS